MNSKSVLRIAGAAVILAGLAIAGWYGFAAWTGAKVRAEVERAFDGLRQKGAKAAFADATFDAARREITVSGISIVSADGGASVKIARLLASGGERPHDGRVALDALDLDGLEISLSGESAGGSPATYTLPKVMIDRYTGPMTLIAAGEGSGPFGGLRVALRQLAATTAAKVTIPEMRGRIEPPGAPPVEAAYTNIAAEGVNAGTIRSLIIDRTTFAFTPAAPPPADKAQTDKAPTDKGQADKTPADKAPGRITGRVDGLVAARIDTAPLLAMTKPPGAPTTVRLDDYAMIYGKVVTGPYTLAQENGPRLRAASVLLEHVGIKPSAFDPKRLAALDALTLRAADPTAEESRQMLELSRDLIDGIAFRTFALTNVETEEAGEKGRIASMRVDGLAASIIDSISFEGIEGQSGTGGAGKVGRIAVRRLDLSQLSRLAAEASAPSPLSSLVLFRLLSGIEVSGLEVPYDGGDAKAEPVKIGDFALSWGTAPGAPQGVLPTWLDFRLSDVSGPIRAEDGEPFTYLVKAGLTRATISLALKAAYDPDKRTLTLAPMSSEVKDAFRVNVESTLGDVPPTAFSELTGLLSAAPDVSAGPVTVTLTDLGLGKLMYAQFAAAAGESVEDYKAQVVELAEAFAAELAESEPDVAEVGAAVVAFLRNPGTLTVTATPRDHLPLMALTMATEPLQVLGAFSFKASATAP
ncbi:hypothetical protein V5F59_20405 [Xanthobacter autotrophicus DSM 431]|uniref:hypothetical protein n=1 Tax=Xanthobacter nonsaccharivorans TaxID=3119912 RepID=UPI00372B6DFC